ncbi:unnamed protein product [Acanthoscelides obtectus]|uniref:Uncharacterized protein n=1 Tax=Acanthoscelides obtectus TaxID=200917 RepID=A0A9P0M7Q7_ACAOB|nr:unnamed protein product [Acanthoscelides obtectus]CAK1689223.1 hypothetical protein AOBTE_LOCUS37096 [Acanthoscelides obtectus]
MEYSEEIFNFLSIVIPSGKGVQRCYQSPNEKRNRLDIISRGDLRLTLTKLTPKVDNLLLKYQICTSHQFSQTTNHTVYKDSSHMTVTP